MSDRPTIEQVAWVFRHLDDHLRANGTFRHLIYDRMGFGPEAYQPLFEAGAMNVHNSFGCSDTLYELLPLLRELNGKRDDEALWAKVNAILEREWL